MYLYNSATHKKEEFKTHTPGRVEMYTCGPTVYHFAHIGNLRSYIMEDVLEKFLRWTGYDVHRVMNITDVGPVSYTHLDVYKRQALDPTYARALGVQVEDMLIAQPDTGEQALEITEALVRSGAIDVVVVDSVAALVPRAEIEGEMGDSYVGLQARLMSQALRKLTGAIGKTNCIVIFINQLREKVGIMYGNPEVTTGGRALKLSLIHICRGV